MRFNGHRYVDCRWCGGKGCLCCEGEADKAYKCACPDGPKPIATFRLDVPGDVERARSVLGVEALQKAFGAGGGGMSEFMANIEKAGGNA